MATWKPLKAAALSPKGLALIQECFRRGNLEPLLHPGQRKLRDQFYSASPTILVFNIARQWGKTHLAVSLAIEHAIRNPGSLVLYVSPMAKQTREIAFPKFREILAWCPLDYPIKKRRDEYHFPNGSVIRLAGLHPDPEKLRGQSPNLVFLDESGSMGRLDYVVEQVLLPAFNATHGRMVMVSTPPSTAGHPFKRFLLDAVATGHYAHARYDENPFIDHDRHEKEVVSRYPGGADNPRYKIEYLADFNIQDTEFRVTPQFDRATHAAFFQDYHPPEVFQPYVGIDFGYHPHHSAVVFGYLDFRRALLVIEDEFHAGQLTSVALAEAIQAKEAALWGNRPSHLPMLPPPIRIADNNNPMLIADFMRLHSIPVEVVRKTSQDEMLNRLNLHLDERQAGGAKIRIHPRCTQLSFELENGLWNANRLDYMKQPDGTHLDCLDALKYLNLELQWNRSPYDRMSYDPQKVFVPVQQHRPTRDSLFGLG